MPLRPTKVGDTVKYRDATGASQNVIISAVQGPAPSVPVGVGNGTGGTLAAATYIYKITYTIGGVESEMSAPSTGVVTTGSTSRVDLTWSAVTGATNYKLYGRTGGSFLQIYSGATPSFSDTGSVTPSGAGPATDGKANFTGPHDFLARTAILPGMGANQYENRW